MLYTNIEPENNFILANLQEMHKLTDISFQLDLSIEINYFNDLVYLLGDEIQEVQLNTLLDGVEVYERIRQELA